MWGSRVSSKRVEGGERGGRDRFRETGLPGRESIGGGSQSSSGVDLSTSDEERSSVETLKRKNPSNDNHSCNSLWKSSPPIVAPGLLSVPPTLSNLVDWFLTISFPKDIVNDSESRETVEVELGFTESGEEVEDVE